MSAAAPGERQPSAVHAAAGGRSLLPLLAAASTIAVVSAALSWWPNWTEEFPLGVIYVLVVGSFAVSGAFLLADRQTGHTGWYMIVAACCYEVSWWWIWPDSWQIGPLPLISFLIGYWWFAVGGLALLRYPEPSLAYRYERAYFIAFAVWIISSKLIIAMISEPEWSGLSTHAWWPTVAPDARLFQASAAVFKLGTLAFAFGLLALLVFKIRRTRGVERADTLPASLAAMAIVVMGSGYLIAQLGRLNAHVTDALRTVTAIAALVAPLAFLVSLIQRRLARSSVADLVVSLAGCRSLTDVQQALRDVLEDPSAVLAVPAGEALRYVTYEGHPLTADETAGWWVPMPGVTEVPVAMLIVDRSLRRRADLVRSAAIAGGLVLENGLLHDGLATQLVEVRASRRRIAEAGLAERRRIERNLHDGAQQLLLSAASRLSLAQQRARQGRDPSEAIAAAGNDLATALTELRNLARGIHPAVLHEYGLKAALDSVVGRLSVPSVLSVTTTRLPEVVESTLYFVACEAIANVVKHAAASSMEITVGIDGPWITTRITDNGRGGADAAAGTGLSGINDRIDALRGETFINSPRGRGTTIMVRVPCEQR